MAEVTVLRVEVVNVESGDDKSLETKRTTAAYTEDAKLKGTTNKELLQSNSATNEIPRPEDSEVEPKKKFNITKEQFSSGTKIAGKIASKGAALATAGVALYTDYVATGQTLSGANHSASKMTRIGSGTAQGIGLGVALVANPAVAALAVAYKAWALAKANRQENFKLRTSAITSQLLQENLVKDTIGRRF